jgi:hypothetical protein
MLSPLKLQLWIYVTNVGASALDICYYHWSFSSGYMLLTLELQLYTHVLAMGASAVDIYMNKIGDSALVKCISIVASSLDILHLLTSEL